MAQTNQRTTREKAEDVSLSYEVAVEKLEGIVRKLENGDLTLEDSLKAFEEGIVLTRTCEKILQEAKGKVELLVQKQSK